MRNTPLFEDLLAGKPGLRLLRNVPLSRHSSFQIGGCADLFLEIRTPGDLGFVVTSARRAGIRLFVIGSGTNILFDDRGFRGLIVKNSARTVRVEPDGESLNVESGAPLSAVLQRAAINRLTGLEFLSGIPGTLGGAFYSNAGAFGCSIGETVESGDILNLRGETVRIRREDFGFAYRFSALQKKPDILLNATLRLRKGNEEKIRAACRDIMEERRAKHPPWGTPCAGSYFKNPSKKDGCRIPAGRLLEQSGARGLKIGDAAVSDKHCNFIINLGRATADEVRALAEELKARVLRETGILLEEEVIFVREDASMP